MATAKSTFVIDKKVPTAVEWNVGGAARNRYEKTFSGDITGTSLVEATMLGLGDGKPLVYIAIEGLDVTVNGRKGTFILLHRAVHPEDGTTAWTILDGSGSGELAGIRGSGTITPGHEFTLEYEL
ncbi:MAG TPA: DUF3224 domain-containing protein [Vicinamibacterales bacterium]|nr:DUF3224 domain-containing protein [Vicinamibacterales bacterium]